MKNMALALLIIAVLVVPVMAEEYAIIRDSLFGAQKIDFYATREEALQHYSGEGRLYRITRVPVPVKRVETRKKVEVTEHSWVIDEGKPGRPAGSPPKGRSTVSP